MNIFLSQLANIVTLSRILGVGLILWMTPVQTNIHLLILLTIYTLVCVTDFLDGYIARRLNTVSDFGKIMDPLADKILVLVFLPLLQMRLISSFPVFLILTREFIIMGVRVVAASKGMIIPAGLSGKIKTALTLPICGFLFARASVETLQVPYFFWPMEKLRVWILTWPDHVIRLLVAIMVLVTLWSLVDYLRLFLWKYGLEKARHEGSKLGLYRLRVLIPNFVTALNLGCGLLATGLVWFVDIRIPVFLVLLGTIFDSLDGKLARRLNVSSPFGAKLDSKADSVNFGIAPAMIIAVVFFQYSLPGAICLSVVYAVSVYYRLRRFDQGGHSEYFEGLPSPVAAGLIVLAAASNVISPVFFCSMILVLSLLMVSKFAYPHMDIARRLRLFRLLRLPVLTCFGLVVARLWQSPFLNNVPSIELLMVLMLPYLLYPLFQMKFFSMFKR